MRHNQDTSPPDAPLIPHWPAAEIAGAVVLAGAAGVAPAHAAADPPKKAKAKKPKPVFLGEGLSYIVKKENDSALKSIAPAVQVCAKSISACVSLATP